MLTVFLEHSLAFFPYAMSFFVEVRRLKMSGSGNTLTNIVPAPRRRRKPKELSALDMGTQREYSSKPLKHSNVERILVFER